MGSNCNRRGKTIRLSEKAYNAELNKSYTEGYKAGYSAGIREVKIDFVNSFCNVTKCNVCPLKSESWSTSTPFGKCLIADQSNDEELDKAIGLIVDYLEKNRR